MALTAERRKLYERLERVVGHTLLEEVKHISIPHNNRIFFKAEYTNPTGSHYDRAMLRLLRAKEEQGWIAPGAKPLMETTTGNSGASFAWLCRVLGYEAHVFIPEDMASARIAQLKYFGANVHFSPAGRYVAGLLESFRAFIDKYSGKYALLNHSADEVHVIDAMQDLAKEITSDLEKYEIKRIDYFVSALGNGTTTRGLGDYFQKTFNTKIIGVEPIESPTIFQKRFPDRFAQRFKELSLTGQHGLIGTGPGVVDFGFPNMAAIMKQIDDIITVDRTEWESSLIALEDVEGKHVGHTSAACFHAALQLAETVSNKVFILLFYDPGWKYLNLDS